jgi:hypothetical protein
MILWDSRKPKWPQALSKILNIGFSTTIARSWTHGRQVHRSTNRLRQRSGSPSNAGIVSGLNRARCGILVRPFQTQRESHRR